MQTFTGKYKEFYDHPDILVSAKPYCRSGAEWMIEFFENRIQEGERFRPGELVQIGWGLISLAEATGDRLQVLEPDFESFPINWVPGATNTIRHLTVQKEVCDQLQVEASYPSLRQSGVVSPDFMAHRAPFEMKRYDEEGADSGWLFREHNYHGDSGSLNSLYEIAIRVPEVIPFLALPTGYSAKRTSTEIQVFSPTERISSADNSFLAQLLTSAFFQ